MAREEAGHSFNNFWAGINLPGKDSLLGGSRRQEAQMSWNSVMMHEPNEPPDQAAYDPERGKEAEDSEHFG